jgi:hypothetical protein
MTYDDDDERPYPLARRTDPWTSHAAIPTKGELNPLESLVLETLDRENRPLTRYEIGDYAGKNGLWRRPSRLIEKEYIWVVGHKINPASGKNCQTLDLTDKGKAEVKRLKDRKKND